MRKDMQKIYDKKKFIYWFYANPETFDWKIVFSKKLNKTERNKYIKQIKIMAKKIEVKVTFSEEK